MNRAVAVFLTASVLFAGLTSHAQADAVPTRVLELPARPNNPRNSEGDFAVLNDGRIVYTYSHYSTAAGGR